MFLSSLAKKEWCLLVTYHHWGFARSYDGAIVPAHNVHALQGGGVLAAFATEPGLGQASIRPSAGGSTKREWNLGANVRVAWQTHLHVAARSGSF